MKKSGRFLLCIHDLPTSSESNVCGGHRVMRQTQIAARTKARPGTSRPESLVKRAARRDSWSFEYTA